MRAVLVLFAGALFLGTVACERARGGAEEVGTRVTCAVFGASDARPRACACTRWRDGSRTGTICVEVEHARAPSTADGRPR